MASTHPELADQTVRAARWLANTGEQLDEPILPMLQERFGLSRLQSAQALCEAVIANAAALGLDPRDACLRMLAEEARQQRLRLPS